jgi:hypothetical protein
MNDMNARQEAFSRLHGLFTALILIIPDRELTIQEEEGASEVVYQEFTKIMDRYDTRRDER